jgi:hypothetical protein
MNFYYVAVSIQLPAYGSRAVSGESSHRCFKVMADGGDYAALKVTKFVRRKFRGKIKKTTTRRKVFMSALHAALSANGQYGPPPRYSLNCSAAMQLTPSRTQH